MRQSFASVATASLLVLATTATAGAAAFITDRFDTYSLGNLGGQGPWVAYSAAGTSPVQVVSDSAIPGDRSIRLVQGLAAGEDVNVPLGRDMAAGEKWYAAFDVTVTDAVTSNEYFASFQQIVAGTNFFPSKTGVAPSTNGGDFTFYMLQGAGSGALPPADATIAAWPTGFAYNTTHRLVISYTYDDGTGELWVDPDPALGEASPHITVINTAGSAAIEANLFAFGQRTRAGGNLRVDDFIAGDAFADVVAVAVPEPATLSSLGLLLTAACRRRRR